MAALQVGRPLWVGVLVAVLGASLVGAQRQGWLPLDALELLELETLDLRFRVRGPQPVGDEVVLLAFDDATLERAPELFERRAGQARVFDAASGLGAAVIGVDLLYTDPERILPAEVVEEVGAWLEVEALPDEPPREAAARAILDDIHAEVRGDDELAAAIKAAGNVVLAFHVGQHGTLDGDDRQLARGKYGQTVAGPHSPVSQDRVLASLSQLNRAAKGLGLMTTHQDLSGMVRDVPMGVAFGQSVLMPLSVHLVARYEGINRGKLAYLGNEGTVHIGEREIAAPHGKLRLNWRGPGAFPTYSVIDLVEGRVPPEAIEGRIAIYGFTHLAQDAVQTPFGRQPGMEVHATAVDNILRGDPLRRAAPWQDALLSLLAGLAVSLLFVFRRLGPGGQVVGSAVVLAGAAASVQALFSTQGLWIHGVGPLLTGTLASAGALATAYLREGLQRRYLRRTFAHYLSDDLVAELVADPSRVSLTGERREITVLFTDIRDFTAFSERTEPLDLAGFLNAYFTPMTRAVLDNSGYVDKFIGDAIMALFGAPVRHRDHASEGCQCALDMYDALQGLRPVAAERDIDLAIGVGLNTGFMVVGNLGSETRFDYTVLGDAVNLASRVEGLTKQYGVFCLAGSNTVDKARGFVFRTVDLVRVKGKDEPVEIFELCSGPRNAVSSYAEVPLYEEAQVAYRAGDFPLARERFEAFAVHNPDDPVTALFLERLEALGAEAPQGWDGAFTFTKK